MIDRIPPQNIEAEEAVLAACLLSQKAFEDSLGILQPSDFYRTAHQVIYEAFLSLQSNKTPVDLITTKDALRDLGKLDEIGGATYLSHLIDECPMATHMVHYCGILKRKATAREMIETCFGIIQACFEATDDSLSEVIDEAQSNVLNIAMDTGQDTFHAMDRLFMEGVERWEGLNEGRKKRGLKTGFKEIDFVTGGFFGSKLIIIAARPRIGKTALMINMSQNMAGDGHKVGIFSIEMDKEDILDRFVSSKTGINSMRLSFGSGPNADEWQRINSVGDVFSKYPILIDDSGGLTIQELKRRARRMRKEGAEIIFIDQLSKIRGDRRRNKFEEATGIVEELADLKKELRIPVILLAQINRKAEDRDNKKPTLADLKNTGQLEEDADIVFLGHRAYEYTKDPEDKHKATWEVAKHRGGPCRTIRMGWAAKTTTFSDEA